MRRNWLKLICITLGVGMLAVACGGSSGGGGVQAGGGSIKADSSLQGKSITVGSKEFVESQILGQITILALQGAGAKTVDKTNIKGSTAARNALINGQTDIYWDYTGTGWITYLNHTDHFPDQAQQFQATAQEDLQKNHLKWFAMSPLNDTYAMAMGPDTAKKLSQVNSLSDLATLSQQQPSQATFCIASEFSTRSDGFPGMNQAYGIKVDPNNVKTLDEGVIYTQTAKGTCNFGEVFTTDGRIKGQNLKVLSDPKKFFPNYNAAVVTREQTFNQYPGLDKVMTPISAKLNDQVITDLNAQVSVQGKTPKAVAQQWMTSQGFVKT
jgi:osmoprotectant transport system substrate-binding protein